MVCEQGRERSRQEYRRLLERAGFRLGRVTAHALISAIEGVAI